ncbi:MAG: hypothetical protein EXS52_01570 [Candidatus Staskawiczbacteria bacterium]|nr:hypothetical protein [Candidatus Staskawiczbacteria bacterium]
MTTLALTYKGIHQKVASLSLPSINWKLVSLLGILFFVAMLVSYVFLVNELTKGVYLIKSYNKEISSLSKENRILETNFAESGFLGKVTQQARSFNFEKTTAVTYIQVLNSPLAQAR